MGNFTEQHWGIPPSAVTPAFAGLVVDKGCTLICPTNDVKLVTAGLLKVKEQFSDLW